ncbi:hypothetical protein [Streptomyces sp. NPDC060198]|uniref:hypothetical protein n=1 Tax=Streptomyces sp. NPDC060198 TaxID=3347070 RepID=UPI0036697CC8
MRDRSRAPLSLASDPDMDAALAAARTALDNPTRVLMAAIGAALMTTRPTLAMREATRLAYASRVSSTVHGFGTSRAATANALLLRHMPRVDNPRPPAPITRAEYGMRLLKKAGTEAVAAAARWAAAERVAELHRQAAADYSNAQAARNAHSTRAAMCILTAATPTHGGAA